jgi:S-formylglutathione hydrolase FrmB
VNGKIERLSLKSRALEGNPRGDPSTREVTVYVPPASGPLPVFYFLHGFGSGGAAWTNASGFTPNVPERLDALITQKRIRPVYGVFVDGWTSLGGCQWINTEGLGRYADYVAEDVVGLVDGSFSTVRDRAGRAVIGKSSGGYGAWTLGRDRSSVFGHIAAHSADAYFEYAYFPELPKALAAINKAGGAKAWYDDFVRRARETRMRNDDHAALNIMAMSANYSPRTEASLGLELPFDLSTGAVRNDVWSQWLMQDPVRFVPKHLDAYRSLKTVFVDCGTRDEFFLQWGARMIVRTLRQAGVDVIHEEFEDGHMNINYRYERSMLAIAARLEGP